MKEIKKSLLRVVLVVLAAVLGYFIFQNYGQAKAEKARQNALASPSPVAAATPTPTPTPAAVENVSLTVCGDIVCHTGLNAEAKNKDGTYDYAPIFSGVTPFVTKADYALCTMETTFPDTTEYSGYPMFKSPAALAGGLKVVGFDLINTASNHCMDSGVDGLLRTLDVLDQNGLDHVGTYRTQAERDKNNGILVKEINGVKLAFLSFTYGTNGMPVTDAPYVANIFCRDYLTTLTDIDYDLLKTDMEAAKKLDADLIIVQMHWGSEYHTEPNDQQAALANFLFSQGADIVLGGHTHVPEPMELRVIEDASGNKRTGLLVYSLGNFVSCQNDRYTNLTAALNIDLEKNVDTGKTRIKHVSYAPMFMVDLSDVGASADWQYRLWNLHDAIDSYKAGNNLGVINDTLYNNMVQGLTDVHGILGEDFDAYGESGGVDVDAWTEKNS
ncbi:MAG: CapA family protein [Oscillospiraceae bacterium]|jgi:poly-gamma-glutamate capsule biosynthesis protein CapA/YwtB (metallophosphatase superfamily)